MADNHDLKVLRHSAAHLLAQAVSELFPNTKLTIGPATEEGFFYDFLPERNFRDEDLPAITARMQELVKKDLKLEHKEISKTEARELYKNNQFKLELIDNLPGDTVGLSTQGDFYDLCRGGHVKSTGELANFKLQNISGAYWRADREGQALQRISGTAFFTTQDLAEYELRREEALKYDHRKLGREMDLFSFHDEGPGFPFFHPKGKIIINKLVEELRKLRLAKNYDEISTPIILSDELWRRSGHYQHYRENMYFCQIDEQNYAIKPMNCPGSILVFKTRPRSYRELPLRLSEFGLVHRHELSGVLHGLFRVRAFTQDDCHTYCTVDQIENEIVEIIKIAQYVFGKYGFANLDIAVSTKPAKSLGTEAVWAQATTALENALQQANLPYRIQPGEGAFYGPKIEFKIKDSMGREWQCGTIQVDFFQAENFDLSYISAEGKKERPVIIHHVIYGSLERFLGILLEHHKGWLPFSLAPVQLRVLTITDKQQNYAAQIVDQLRAANLRAELDPSSDPLSGKIKNAQLDRIPYMVIVGDKEMEKNTVTIRHHHGQQEQNLTIYELLKKAESLLK